MHVLDLLRAAPGVVIFGLLPGLGLATLLVPRWSAWLRLAAAPGLSAGVVGILGLAAHDARAPFRPWWVGLVIALLLAAALWRRHTARAATDGPQPKQRPPRGARFREAAPQLVALACGVVLAATVAVAFRNEPVPVDSDPAVHAAVAERIAQQGDILPVLPVPVEHTGVVRPRAAAEAVAALAASAGAASPTQALLPEALLAILLTPLGLCMLALELTRSRAVAALAAPLAAGMAYPALPILFGELPLLVDSTLVVPLVIAALRVLRADDRAGNATLLTAATASVWVIHGTEALTAAVVAVPLALFALREMPRARWLRGAVTAVVACAAGALLVHLLTRVPAVASPITDAVGGAAVPEATTVGGGVSVADFPRDFIDFVFPQRLWLVPYALGLIAAVRTRGLRGLFVAHLLFVLFLLDVTTHRLLIGVWERVFPWSEPDRLASVQYWVLPVMMAAGLVLAWQWLRDRVPDRRVALVAAAVVAGLAVGIGRDHDAHTYANATSSVGMVSAADLRVMEQMAGQLPASTAVLTDGYDDAGQWIAALTPDAQFLTKDYLISHPQDARVAAVAGACTDPQSAAKALRGSGAVFVGARVRATAKYHWDAACIARLPGVRLLAEEHDGGRISAAFAVTAP
jgi:hypothetical protein